jgi:hypothetical protein
MSTANDFASQTYRQIDARLQRDLTGQLDGVVEFADFCAFLAPASGGERAQQLIDLARGLYDETLRLLQERGQDEPSRAS